MSRENTKTYTTIGGQALMEGILMRGPKQTSISVRLPDGSISTEFIQKDFIRDKNRFFNLPLVRGVTGFIDSMSLAYKALAVSAEKAGIEEEEPSKFDKWLNRVFGDKLMNAVMTVAGFLGVVLAIALFFVLPTWLFNLSQQYVFGNGIAGWRSIFEGVLRIAIFVLYILFCSKIPEIKRVFMYHGAEHKTIFCYENEEELTVENVRKHSRFHPRCGTSFMIIMLMLGVVIGFFIPFSNPFLRAFVKILCIPIVVGIGYELLRLCGKHDNLFTRIVSAPGMWMQHITTGEPDDSMIEVAIEALKPVIPENGEDKVVV